MLINPTVGQLKTWSCTLASPQETREGTPIALPTTEGTPQADYTLAGSDFYTETGHSLYDVTPMAAIIASGQNTSGSSQTVYWKSFKGAVEVSNGSFSCGAGDYWTVHCFFADVATSDVYKVAVWASSADVNRNFKGLAVYPSRHKPEDDLMMKDVDITVDYVPNWSIGAPAIPSYDSGYLYQIADNAVTGNWQGFFTGATTLDQMYSAGYIYRSKWSDFYYADDGQEFTHATGNPRFYYERNPLTITWRRQISGNHINR